jgi:hypothetical protein
MRGGLPFRRFHVTAGLEALRELIAAVSAVGDVPT